MSDFTNSIKSIIKKLIEIVKKVYKYKIFNINVFNVVVILLSIKFLKILYNKYFIFILFNLLKLSINCKKIDKINY